TSLFLGGCADKTAQPTEAAAEIAIPLNDGYAQTLLPDIYPSAPEVVRYYRSRLVAISPSQAKRYTLEQSVRLRNPA
ncbi:conjugal transfer protein, partial [Proteus mirabilis]|nr:conjugal transfer protein [Proteus mirabilis]